MVWDELWPAGSDQSVLREVAAEPPAPSLPQRSAAVSETLFPTAVILHELTLAPQNWVSVKSTLHGKFDEPTGLDSNKY